MLIRCTYCGRPVYISERSIRMVECSFCDQMVQPERTEEITCDSDEWQEPIQDVLRRNLRNIEKTRIWLRLIGEPEKAERAVSEKIRTIQEEVEREMAAGSDVLVLKRLRSQYLQLPEGDRSEELLEKLEKEIEKKNEQEIDRIREELKEIQHTSQLKLIINRLNRLEDYPRAKEMLPEAVKRLSEFLRRDEEREERIRLQILQQTRRKKAIKAGAAAAVILLLTCFFLINSLVIRPARLENARTKLRNGEYQEAASASFQLKYGFFGFTPEVTKEAEAIYSEAMLALGDECMADQKWKEATENYHAAGNSEKEAEARRKYGDSLAEAGDYWAAISQWKDVPDGDDRVEELIAGNVIYQIKQGNYEAAAYAFPEPKESHEKAIAILKKQGITPNQIYLDWGKALTESEKTQEAISILKHADETPETHSLIVNLYLTLGQEKIKEGQTEEAIRALNQAAELPEAQILLQQQHRIRDEELVRQTAALLSENKHQGEKQEWETLRMLRSIATEFSTAESVMQFCSVLDGKGIDLKSTFPEGLPFPEPEGISFLDYSYLDLMFKVTNEPLDESRPLVLLCRQKDIELKKSEKTLGSTEEKKRGWLFLPTLKMEIISLTEGETEYEWRFLPELWQKLPEKRRPVSLENATCVLIVKMEYQYSNGVMLGQSQIPFYRQSYQLLLWDRHSGRIIPKGINRKMNSTFDDEMPAMTGEKKTELLTNLFIALEMGHPVSAQQMKLAEPFTFAPVQQNLDKEYERLSGRGESF